MDLVFVLLNSSRPVSRAELLARVPGYGPESDPSTLRMFERDKDDLRDDLRIPLRMGTISTTDGELEGYWIDEKSWLLPPLSLTPRERAYIALAGSVWENRQIASAARDAGLQMGRSSDARPLAVAAQHAVLGDLFDAITSGVVVEFTYDSKRGGSVAVRRVEPWRLFCTGGAWYLIGFDVDAVGPDGGVGGRRVFRLSRLRSDVALLDVPATHEPPEDLDVRELVAGWVALPGPSRTAVLRVPAGTCAHLHVLAHSLTPDGDDDVLRIDYEFEDRLARSIAATCDRVTVVEPQELRDAVTSLVDGAMAHV